MNLLLAVIILMTQAPPPARRPETMGETFARLLRTLPEG